MVRGLFFPLKILLQLSSGFVDDVDDGFEFVAEFLWEVGAGVDDLVQLGQGVFVGHAASGAEGLVFVDGGDELGLFQHFQDVGFGGGFGHVDLGGVLILQEVVRGGDPGEVGVDVDAGFLLEDAVGPFGVAAPEVDHGFGLGRDAGGLQTVEDLLLVLIGDGLFGEEFGDGLGAAVDEGVERAAGRDEQLADGEVEVVAALERAGFADVVEHGGAHHPRGILVGQVEFLPQFGVDRLDDPGHVQRVLEMRPDLRQPRPQLRMLVQVEPDVERRHFLHDGLLGLLLEPLVLRMFLPRDLRKSFAVHRGAGLVLHQYSTL